MSDCIQVIEVQVTTGPDLIEIAVPGQQGPAYGNIDGGAAATVFIDNMAIDCGDA